MLEHPVDDWVIDRDVLVYPLLEAQLDGAEQPPDQPYRLLDITVGLGVVRSRVFLTQLLKVFALDLRQLKDSSYQLLYRWFAVGLHDDACVAEPPHDLDHHLGDDVVLVSALAGDHETVNGLGTRASHRDALHELPPAPGLVDFALAFVDLLAPLHSTFRDEEVVEADDGNTRSCGFLVEKSTSAAEYAPLAPRPVGDMCAPVFLYLTMCRLTWVSCCAHGLDLLLLDSNLSLCADIVLCRCHQPVHSPAPVGRGAAQSAFEARAYRSILGGRRRQAHASRPRRPKADISISAR